MLLLGSAALLTTASSSASVTSKYTTTTNIARMTNASRLGSTTLIVWCALTRHDNAVGHRLPGTIDAQHAAVGRDESNSKGKSEKANERANKNLLLSFPGGYGRTPRNLISTKSTTTQTQKQ